MAKKWREYELEMIRENPQCGTYKSTKKVVAYSEKNALKIGWKKTNCIYGSLFPSGVILSVSEPLVEGVDFRVMWADTNTSRSWQYGVRLDEPDVDFIKKKMAEDENYSKIYWDLKREGRIK